MSPEPGIDRALVLRPFRPLVADRSLHVHLLQLVGFAYAAWRLLSRDYTVYGLLPEEAFDYAAAQTVQIEIWPVPLLHLLSGQFLYHWLPHPSEGVLLGLQVGGAVACGLGLLGLLPRLAAAIAFSVLLHLTGLMQATNSMIDGGSLAMVLLLVLAVSPRGNFLRWFRDPRPGRLAVDHRWPVFVLFLFAGAFYTTAGLNKVVHDGPHWPFAVHLENLARLGLERSLFVANRHSCPGVCWLMDDAALSVVAGFVTLLAELLFVSILWWPRLRLPLVLAMGVMHVLVFDMQGINFLGTTFILFLCLDWNACRRGLEVVVAPRCSLTARLAARGARSTPLAPPPGTDAALARRGALARDETGEWFSGAEVLDQLLLRRPLLWPLAALLRIPGCLRLVDRIGFDRPASGG